MAWSPRHGDFQRRPPSPGFGYDDRRRERPPPGRYEEEPYYGAYDNSMSQNDWEEERYRQWEQYERARAEWERRMDEYRGRGYPDPYSRDKRPRSPSPYERYARPRRDSYDGHIRGRDFYDRSPPRRDFSPDSFRRRPSSFPDPMTQDKVVTFRAFCDWFRDVYPDRFRDEEAEKADENEPNKPYGMRLRYDEYRTAFNQKQVKPLFEKHRKAAWFLEKYDPSETYVDLRNRIRKKGWAGVLDNFIAELADGKHDPVPDATAKTVTTNGQPSSITAATETEATSQPQTDNPAAKPEEEERQEERQEEDPEMGDQQKDTDQLEKDEILIPHKGHQVMIKTIPSDIGRLRLEPLVEQLNGVVSLALGEPVSRRNYLRSAWIEFDSEKNARAAMEQLMGKEIDNFRLHVTMINTPLIAKIKRTSVLLSTQDRLTKDLQTMKDLSAVLEKEADMLEKYVPLSQRPKPDTEEPKPSEDPPMSGVEPTNGGELPPPADDSHIHRGTRAIEERLSTILGPVTDDESGYKRLSMSVDLYLNYLRNAFHCCYYCAVIADRGDELQRKCVRHIRSPFSAQDFSDLTRNARKRERDEHWLMVHDDKMDALIQRDTMDPTRFGGKNLEEELPTILNEHYKREEESKYRCQKCNKMFKSVGYVCKHISNKHPELLENDLMYEFRLYNNFAMDPHRVQVPPPMPPPSTRQNSRRSPPPDRKGGEGSSSGPPPKRRTPPPNVKSDPRAAQQRNLSYQDLDEVVGEDIALMY